MDYKSTSENLATLYDDVLFKNMIFESETHGNHAYELFVQLASMYVLTSNHARLTAPPTMDDVYKTLTTILNVIGANLKLSGMKSLMNAINTRFPKYVYQGTTAGNRPTLLTAPSTFSMTDKFPPLYEKARVDLERKYLPALPVTSFVTRTSSLERGVSSESKTDDKDTVCSSESKMSSPVVNKKKRNLDTLNANDPLTLPPPKFEFDTTTFTSDVKLKKMMEALRKDGNAPVYACYFRYLSSCGMNCGTRFQEIVFANEEHEDSKPLFALDFVFCASSTPYKSVLVYIDSVMRYLLRFFFAVLPLTPYCVMMSLKKKLDELLPLTRLIEMIGPLLDGIVQVCSRYQVIFGDVYMESFSATRFPDTLRDVIFLDLCRIRKVCCEEFAKFECSKVDIIPCEKFYQYRYDHLMAMRISKENDIHFPPIPTVESYTALEMKRQKSS